MTDYRSTVSAAQGEIDQGLRSFLLGTYRYMAMAMAVTALSAYGFSQYLVANPQMLAVLYNGFTGLIVVAVIWIGFASVGRRLPQMSLTSVLAFLFGFAAFMGIFMSAIAIFYDPMIIARIFFMTVAMFAGLSLFGYSTQHNLSTYVKYAIVAFFAFIIVNLLGMFVPGLRPTGVAHTFINLVALAAIALITAWETQTLKRLYYSIAHEAELTQKMAAYGAASLLLSFINMFQILLSLFGRE